MSFELNFHKTCSFLVEHTLIEDIFFQGINVQILLEQNAENMTYYIFLEKENSALFKECGPGFSIVF